MTQAELAEEMSLRGEIFHQQTVLRVEKGLRPLRVTEWNLMAEVLDAPPDALAATSTAASAEYVRIKGLIAELERRSNLVSDNVEDCESLTAAIVSTASSAAVWPNLTTRQQAEIKARSSELWQKVHSAFERLDHSMGVTPEQLEVRSDDPDA